MNDRLSKKAIAAISQSSPSCLLQGLGLEDVLVMRLGQLPEKSGVVNITEIDQDIRNRGRAWIFRPAKNGEWALIYLFDRSNHYRCHWIEFDYTKGTFHFGMTQTGMTGNRCKPFLMALSELPRVRLLPVRHCDII